MIKLTDEKYLPRLADGYRWNYHLDSIGRVHLEIQCSILSGWSTVRSRSEYVDHDATVDGLREFILDMAESMMVGFVPWSPQCAAVWSEVQKGLVEPEDDTPAAYTTTTW